MFALEEKDRKKREKEPKSKNERIKKNVPAKRGHFSQGVSKLQEQPFQVLLFASPALIFGYEDIDAMSRHEGPASMAAIHVHQLDGIRLDSRRGQEYLTVPIQQTGVSISSDICADPKVFAIEKTN